jgi:hypothetical protein
MSPSFDHSVSVPDNVMFRELEGEAVILDLDAEAYFGLDEVGTRMWQRVTEEPSIEVAFEALAREYDVDPDTLRADLEELLETLIDRGLLEVDDG